MSEIVNNASGEPEPSINVINNEERYGMEQDFEAAEGMLTGRMDRPSEFAGVLTSRYGDEVRHQKIPNTGVRQITVVGESGQKLARTGVQSEKLPGKPGVEWRETSNAEVITPVGDYEGKVVAEFGLDREGNDKDEPDTEASATVTRGEYTHRFSAERAGRASALIGQLAAKRAMQATHVERVRRIQEADANMEAYKQKEAAEAEERWKQSEADAAVIERWKRENKVA